MESFDARHPGAYYGSAHEMSLGAGIVYDDVPVATYDRDSQQFQVIDCLALVLTHECDVANERAFNTHVVACPIIPLDAYAEEALDAHSFDHAYNLVRDIAKNIVHRVFFLPPHEIYGGGSPLQNGGLLYLNSLSSIDVTLFQGARSVCAFSTYAMERFDQKLKNHLLRPKDEQLPRLS